MGPVAPQHVGSSWIRDWTRASCIGRRSLYHWATREAQDPLVPLKKYIFGVEPSSLLSKVIAYPWHLIDFVRFFTNARMRMVFNSNSSCVLVGGGRPVLKIAHDKPSGQGRYDMPCYLGTKARTLAQKRSLAYERDHPLYIENLIIVVHDYEASILLDSLFSPGFLMRQMVYSELKWKETNKQKNYNRLVGRGFIWHLSEFPYNLKLAFLPNWGLCKGAHWYEFCCKWGSYLGEGD